MPPDAQMTARLLLELETGEASPTGEESARLLGLLATHEFDLFKAIEAWFDGD